MFSSLISILVGISANALESLPDKSPVIWVATTTHDKKLETFTANQFKKLIADGIEAKSIGASCKFNFEQRASELPNRGHKERNEVSKVHSERVIPICTLKNGLKVRLQPIECQYGQKAFSGDTHTGGAQFEAENIELSINIQCTVTE